MKASWVAMGVAMMALGFSLLALATSYQHSQDMGAMTGSFLVAAFFAFLASIAVGTYCRLQSRKLGASITALIRAIGPLNCISLGLFLSGGYRFFLAGFAAG